MKIKIILLTIVSLFAAKSCEDFINQQPISDVSVESFYTNDNEMEVAMIGAYARLGDVYQREFALTEMRSDNATSVENEGDWQEMDELDVTPTNSFVLEYWDANYIAIGAANTVIEYLDVVEDPALKTQLHGEALFLRSLCHFNLTRLYKDVMYVDHVVLYDDAPDYAQSTESAMYASIAIDLTDAIEYLPIKGDIKPGRATKGAAQALLAKLHLTTGNYAAAETLLSGLMGGSYLLEGDFYDVFYNEQNDEIIFAVEYLNDIDGTSQDFSREFTRSGSASGVNTPTADLVEAWGATDSTFEAGGDDPERLNVSVVYDALDIISVGKFVSNSSEDDLSGNDWIVLRYADVLLMYAEAILADGASSNDAGAVAAYTEVLARAGHDVSAITSFTKDELLLQRRFEFAFEDQRWFDLERFGALQSTMDAYMGTPVDPAMFVLPIPDREIKISDVLDQNDGY